MGCTTSKDGSRPGVPLGGPAKPLNEQSNMLISRILDYQKQSREYLNDLMLEPRSLVPEELRFGYISTNTFFNMFHAGFCGPYIANPKYMLLVDFRSLEEFEESHVHSAMHFTAIPWDAVTFFDFASYSLIVFYDFDGTAAANIYSVLFRARQRLKKLRIDVLVVLGGLKNLDRRFPHLLYRGNEPGNRVIPWMPTLIKNEQVFLGRYEQSEEKTVIKGLGITHVLSIGRSPENCFHGVLYHGLDGETDLEETFRTSFTLISDVVNNGGRVLVHGVDGLNRSAAVIIAYLMKSHPALLEEAFFYVQTLRPFIRMDQGCVEALMRYERELFGYSITDLDEMLWI